MFEFVSHPIDGVIGVAIGRIVGEILIIVATDGIAESIMEHLPQIANQVKNGGKVEKIVESIKASKGVAEAVSKIRTCLKTKMESIFEYVRETSDLGDVIRCKTVDGFEVNLAKSELTDVERKCLTDGCFTGDTLVMTKAGLKELTQYRTAN
ncbi:hypothetical protein [Clostridium septicum]|uniref:hypothetical protein n=1 Tax=Clostridium septicum TaxID=1504 RepID=UPI000FF8C69F|nr:hypothetical protein [Clostridium septicum]QAS59366.1 hypothetical protein EI377_00175 [Clostridium septicum]